jgi:hypothetical protein
MLTSKEKRIVKGISRFLQSVLLLAIRLAITGLIIMLLWNSIVPSIFGFSELNYWKAIGIYMLYHGITYTERKE